MTEYKYISADNHLNTMWLPADVWQKRLPARLRESGPRVVETPEGSFWSWEGRKRTVSAAGSSWKKLADDEFGRVKLEEGTLPPADPLVIRRHMDLAGIRAAVFFGDTRKWKVEDGALRAEMYRACNDFRMELSAQSSGRFIYLPDLPTADPQAALLEFQRVVELGARAVEFSVFDTRVPLGDAAWEPLWEEAAARGVVVCSHTGHGAGTTQSPLQWGRTAGHSTSPFVVARPIADMIFSGVFERHPRLSWLMAECRIGWLPFLFSWMDRQFDIRLPDPAAPLSMSPSAYVSRNVRFTFDQDVVGARLLREDWSGLRDCVMWGCDYPHRQDMWPDPDAEVRRMFEGLDPALRQEILVGRAERLFDFQPCR